MKNYKSFKIGGKDGLFNISTGRDVIINRTEEGDIPLISHQHDNNGIAKYIKQLPNRTLFCYKDTLALADRGVFFATTQKENFHIGIYQDDLAAAIGFSTKTVGRIERGDSTPSAEFMLRISKYFNLLVEDVFHVED